jgi:hypothetical protein
MSLYVEQESSPQSLRNTIEEKKRYHQEVNCTTVYLQEENV